MDSKKCLASSFTAVVLTASLALTACQVPSTTSSDQFSQNSTAPALPANPPVTDPTSESAVAPTHEAASENVGDEYKPFGHFLAIIPAGGTEAPSINGPAEIYVVGTGPTTISAAALFPDKEIISEMYTSVGSKDTPRIAGIIKYRTPAAGLDAPKFELILAEIDPVSNSVTSQAQIYSQEIDDFTYSITGSDGNMVAVDVSKNVPSNSPEFVGTVTGYDVSSGQQVWVTPGAAAGAIFGSVVVVSKRDGVVPEFPDVSCQGGAGTDIATGKSYYSLNFADINSVSSCDLADITPLGVGVFTPNLGGGNKYISFSGNTGHLDIVVATGKKAFLPQKVLAADPTSSLIAGSDVDGLTPESIVVTDALTGEAKWTLPADRVEKLNAEVVSFYGGKLYLKTTDQNPVIDVLTGETVAENSTRYPVGSVDDMTLWSDGMLEKSL